jgi:hypothetical protein
MKSQLLLAITIIILLVTSFGITVVRAETITYDFDNTDFNASQGGVFCTMRVMATITTEPEGNWIAKNIYQVNWTIAITYLNQSLYNDDDFSIVCYNPVNVIQDAGQNTTIYQTTVTPQNSGTLSATFKPSTSMSFSLDSSFSLTVYSKGNIVTSGSWSQGMNNNPPVTIKVLSQQINPSPTIPELPVLVIVPLFAIVLSVALILRYQKKSLT